MSRWPFPRFAAALVATAFLLGADAKPGRAAPDLSALPQPGPSLELIVLEAPGCLYCSIFRRDVLPSYTASPRAQTMPMRFLDLNDEAADKLNLTEPVNIVPTVVLMYDHKEIGRIPGYVGPENFFHSINFMLLGFE
jgi:hypothetical protein